MDDISKLRDVLGRIESGLAGISPDLKPEIQEKKRKEIFGEWSDHMREFKRRIRAWQNEKESERARLQDPQLALFDAAYKKHGQGALPLLDNLNAEQLLHVVEKFKDPLVTSRAVTAVKALDGVDQYTLDRLDTHVKSFINSEQVRDCASQEMQCLNALYEAEQITGSDDPRERLAYGRRVEELRRTIEFYRR